MNAAQITTAEPVPVSAPATHDGLSLEGRRFVVTGVLTNRSIAYSIAEFLQQAGAEIVLTSFGRIRRLTERAARKLPSPPDVLELDINNPEDLDAVARELEARWGGLDGAVHAIAFAPPDAMGGNFLDAPAESAELAFRTSAYSLKSLARVLLPLFESNGGGSIVGLDFDASVAWPVYDWMGVAKASLESVNRYLARDLGARGVRVNLVSCGPLMTVAASGITGGEPIGKAWVTGAPLGWRPDDPSVVAPPVAFLLSDLARAITGEILHVDGGFHAVGHCPP